MPTSHVTASASRSAAAVYHSVSVVHYSVSARFSLSHSLTPPSLLFDGSSFCRSSSDDHPLTCLCGLPGLPVKKPSQVSDWRRALDPRSAVRISAPFVRVSADFGFDCRRSEKNNYDCITVPRFLGGDSQKRFRLSRLFFPLCGVCVKVGVRDRSKHRHRYDHSPEPGTTGYHRVPPGTKHVIVDWFREITSSSGPQFFFTYFLFVSWLLAHNIILAYDFLKF